MKRFAANKVYLSENEVYTNSYVEIDEDGKFLKVAKLSDEQSEICFTPFYNGVLLPFSKEEIQHSLATASDSQSLVSQLFKGEKIGSGTLINEITLLEGDSLLTTGSVVGIVCTPLFSKK